MKHFVILGSGTAGWLTALFIRKILPQSKITVVGSKQVGIVGVGEATTPHIIGFLQFINVNPFDFIKKTGGTIKQGISFENWNGDEKKYFHGFLEKNEMNTFHIPNVFDNDCMSHYLNLINKKGLDYNEYVYGAKLSYENKVDTKNMGFALHFDTHLLSKYLQDIATQRNINFVDGKFRNVETNDKNDITKIILEDEREIDLDFIFDCTGFARLIIDKHYKVKWNSYLKHLPMKKGIPFYLKQDEDIMPYTQAIAMKNGWIWKIPLQHRYGAGYIFDSDYITPDQAQQEVEEFLGHDIQINKLISFEAGRYEKYWVNNCIAVGLSGGFIEPLESTSIFLTLQQLSMLRDYLPSLVGNDIKNKEYYNRVVCHNSDECRNFVYLHYLTKRNDSQFWKDFKQKNLPPDNFKETLTKLKDNNFSNLDLDQNYCNANFADFSFKYVCNGLQLYEKEIDITGLENVVPTVEDYKKQIDYKVANAQSHKQFLQTL